MKSKILALLTAVAVLLTACSGMGSGASVSSNGFLEESKNTSSELSSIDLSSSDVSSSEEVPSKVPLNTDAKGVKHKFDYPFSKDGHKYGRTLDSNMFTSSYGFVYDEKFIYFGNDDESGIEAINRETNKVKVILTLEDLGLDSLKYYGIFPVALTDKYIYIKAAAVDDHLSQLWRCDRLGNNQKLILESKGLYNFDSVQIVDKSIYFVEYLNNDKSNKGGIYKMGLAGQNLKKINNTLRPYSFIVYGGKIYVKGFKKKEIEKLNYYYCGMYSIGTDGKGLETIVKPTGKVGQEYYVHNMLYMDGGIKFVTVKNSDLQSKYTYSYGKVNEDGSVSMIRNISHGKLYSTYGGGIYYSNSKGYLDIEKADYENPHGSKSSDKGFILSYNYKTGKYKKLIDIKYSRQNDDFGICDGAIYYRDVNPKNNKVTWYKYNL